MEKQMRVLSVYSKKMNRTQYHLASFTEPLSKEASNALPVQISEKTDDKHGASSNYRDQYANVHHMVARENFGRDHDFGARMASKKKQSVLVYEEGVNFDSTAEPTTYHGYREDSDAGLHNYALMIYDKKKQGFRLVPVENHVRFEKLKSERKEIGRVPKTVPTIQEVPVEAPETDGKSKSPAKKDTEEKEQLMSMSGLNKFKSAFKRRINQNNKTLLPSKLKKEKPVAQKKSKKGGKRRKIKEEDEDEADFDEENFSNNDDKCGSENEKSPELENAGDGFDKDSDNLSQFSDGAKQIQQNIKDMKSPKTDSKIEEKKEVADGDDGDDDSNSSLASIFSQSDNEGDVQPSASHGQKKRTHKQLS